MKPLLLLLTLFLFGCTQETKCNQYGDIGLCVGSREALNKKASPTGEVYRSVEEMNILGLYDYRNKDFWLRDDIDFNTDKGKGILLHELVHWLQYEMNLDELARDKEQLEPLAYEIERNFISMLQKWREE